MASAWGHRRRCHHPRPVGAPVREIRHRSRLGVRRRPGPPPSAHRQFRARRRPRDREAANASPASLRLRRYLVRAIEHRRRALWLGSVMGRDLRPRPVLGVGQQRLDRGVQITAGCGQVRESAPLTAEVAGLAGPDDLVGVLGGETLIWHAPTVPKGRGRPRSAGVRRWASRSATSTRRVPRSPSSTSG